MLGAKQVGAGGGELELSPEEDEAIQVALGRARISGRWAVSPRAASAELGEAGCCFGRRGP